MDWYDEYIEEPVRDLVRLLRDNGFNTECSCGHDMYIQCQVIPDGELQRLHNLLYNNYESYKIEILLECIDGNWFSTLNIKILKEKDKWILETIK
jgi:hypothetical protein